ncbi:MAG: efflux RND transporter permease subunit, partial [Candidatus Hydrogenedentota bacterium]
LFFFLQRIRPTLIVALAIPASVVVSLVVMFFIGMTLNIVTMCSLIIALGMLVDNAIVVIENIYRYRELGLGPLESARRGAMEVGTAITTATMTTIVVFVSLLYMESGEMGQHMRQFAVPITVALLASLVIALTVIPLATSRMKELSHLKEHPVLRRIIAFAERIFGKWFIRMVRRSSAIHLLQRLVNAYTSTLHWVLRWRLGSVLLIVAFGIVTFLGPFQHVGMQGMPEIDTRQVNISVTFDQNFDMAMAKEAMGKVTSSINAQRDELGIENVFVNYSPEGGEINCFLYEVDEYPNGEEPPYTTEEVLDILWQRFSSPEVGTRLPGTELGFSIAQSEGAARTIRVRMRGDNTSTLMEKAEQFSTLMEQIPNVSEVETDAERDRQEMQIGIDEALAKRFGINPLVLAQTVDFALRGTRLPYMKREGREIPVWAQFREEDRKRKTSLETVSLLAPTGELVPLNRIVDFNKAYSPKVIKRINGKNVTTITANVSGQDLAQIKQHLEVLAAKFPLPPGYSIDLGDELVELAQDRANFITGIILAVVMIYLVMGALFESFVLPLSILTTIPVSFLGVWWTMFLTQTSMDTVAYIGMFLMVGVIVNNGIVIVDHINQLRSRGNDRMPAMLQAGRDRFRPVMMTALTTILGCVPLAMGSGVGGEVAFHSLGKALIGGLTMGTLLTLFVVPLFYSLIDDLRHWMMNYLAGLAALRGKQSIQPPSLGEAK